MTHTPHAEGDPSLEVIPSTQDPVILHTTSVLPSTGDPVLPYGLTNPSSGYSGTDTSAERARRDDSDGTTGNRQSKTFMALHQHGEIGLTWKDLADFFGWHHGQASGALSNLHKAGSIARLSERRDRCKVYVLPEYVNCREIEPYAARQGSEAEATVARLLALIEDADQRSLHWVPTATIKSILKEDS